MAKAASQGGRHRRARRRACRPRILGQRRDARRAAAGRAHLAARAGGLGRGVVEGARRRPAAKAEDARRRRLAARALWLGPDEWLVIDEAGKDPLADCAGVKALHSAVGISHRNVAIAVTGPAAAATINAGCPQDLSLHAFPGRRLLAHHPRQGRDRAAAHGGRRLPRRMLAVVLRLCLDLPDGSREGRGSVGSRPPLNAAAENLQPECTRRPSDGWSNAVRAIAVSCASAGRMRH